MKKLVFTGLAVLAAPAIAADYQSKPLPGTTDTVTYHRGTAVIERDTKFGKVRITPISEETGKPAFVVEILNKTDMPINFGTDSIAAYFSGQNKPTVVYKASDIQKMVQKKAAWASALTSMSGALATNTSYGTACGYGNCITTSVTTPNYFAQANAARNVEAIQYGAGTRIDELARNYLQITTVRPGLSYGGRIALSKPKVKKWPATLVVNVLGEHFNFEMTK